MRKSAAVALALVFAGITFAQPAQSGLREVPNFQVPRDRIGWCKHNPEKCKQMQLKEMKKGERKQ
jgi:hypothetical protein